MLNLGRTDTEGQRAHRAMGRGMAVTAHDGHTRLAEPKLRANDMDDSAADRKLCRVLLEEQHGLGLEFIEARDAAQGLDLCRASPPDCVLLIRDARQSRRSF